MLSVIKRSVYAVGCWFLVISYWFPYSMVHNRAAHLFLWHKVPLS
jgi:hypothetical protein